MLAQTNISDKFSLTLCTNERMQKIIMVNLSHIADDYSRNGLPSLMNSNSISVYLCNIYFSIIFKYNNSMLLKK